MVSKKIKENKLFKFLTNSYVIIFSSFLVWMFFFDTNVQLNKEFKKENATFLASTNLKNKL